jgi:hypothetical protein
MAAQTISAQVTAISFDPLSADADVGGKPLAKYGIFGIVSGHCIALGAPTTNGKLTTAKWLTIL